MIDITYKLNSDIIKNIFNGSESKIGKLGRLGAHFDVMDKEFPLDYIKEKVLSLMYQVYKAGILILLI